MTGNEYQAMLDAIDTPAELLRPESFLPAFQQPTPISREGYMEIIRRRSIVLHVPQEDFARAAENALVVMEGYSRAVNCLCWAQTAAPARGSGKRS